MQHYLNHLINDLREASENVPPVPKYFSDSPYWKLEYIIEWEQAPFEKMDELLGIEVFAFPPSDKLNNAQLTQLVEEIEKLWSAYNFYPDFPDDLPVIIKYELLISFMSKEKVQYLKQSSEFDFCEVDPDTCVFGEDFCRCKDIEDDYDDFIEPKPGELPF